MDPNLEKIRESQSKNIQRGRLHHALHQAQDYLNYVLGYKEKKIREEMDEFVADIKRRVRKDLIRHG